MCEQGMQNHLPQSTSQQPSMPNINLTSADAGPCAPVYRDRPMQMLAPISFSSGSDGAVPGSNPSIQSGNGIQKISGATLSKVHRLLPPPVIVSNQFSYVQADHRQQTQSWTDCSAFARGSQAVHETFRGHFYGHQGIDSVPTLRLMSGVDFPYLSIQVV